MSVSSLIAAILSQTSAGNSPGGSASYEGVNFVWGWGFIKRNPNYDGPAYRARNSVSNEEIDVPFDEDGKCRTRPYGSDTVASILYDQWGATDIDIHDEIGENVDILPVDSQYDTVRVYYTSSSFVFVPIPELYNLTRVVVGAGFVRDVALDSEDNAPLFHFVGAGSNGFSLMHRGDKIEFAYNSSSTRDYDPNNATDGNTGNPGYRWGDFSSLLFDMSRYETNVAVYGNDGNVLLNGPSQDGPPILDPADEPKLYFTRHPGGWFRGSRTEMFAASVPGGLDPADAAQIVQSMRSVLTS